MDPNGSLEDQRGEASYPLSQFLPKVILKKTSQKEVGRGEEEKESNEYIVKLLDHLSDSKKSFTAESAKNDLGSYHPIPPTFGFFALR